MLVRSMPIFLVIYIQDFYGLTETMSRSQGQWPNNEYDGVLLYSELTSSFVATARRRISEYFSFFSFLDKGIALDMKHNIWYKA